MGKLVNINETAQRLGVTVQTIRNWIKDGHVKVKKVGKARYIDENTINALQDTAEDIARQQKALEKLLEEVREEREWREAERYEQKFRSRYANLMVGAAFRNDFFGIMVQLLVMYGSIDARQGSILDKFLNGYTLESIAKDYGLTRERIRQIVEKAIRKSSDLTEIESRLSRAEKAEVENESLKATIRALQEKLKTYEKPVYISDKRKAEVYEIGTLLNKPIYDINLPVRAINCLKGLDCRTVGDICKLQVHDIRRARNTGKKTVAEIEDFLDRNKLSFGMDVDTIITEYSLIKAEYEQG